MNVLIDTNVILDYILKREPFYLISADCLEKLAADNTKIWLTASTVTDIYYLSRKALGDTGAAKQVIVKLLSVFHIAGVDHADCNKALETDMVDFEDALVSVCAKKISAQYIITRSIKHFNRSSVPAIHSENFVKNSRYANT